jgi:hypothetical protein
MVIRSFSAWVRADGPGRLTFQYRLQAELARLRMPERGEGQRVDGLWKHTCFEAFVAVAGGTAYRELNFSPSGDWAAYELASYRQGMLPARLKALPQIEVSQGKSRMQLDVQVAWPADEEHEVLRVGLAAVIEAEDGSLSYWAARHAPGKKPDFHHPESLALEVHT